MELTGVGDSMPAKRATHSQASTARGTVGSSKEPSGGNGKHLKPSPASPPTVFRDISASKSSSSSDGDIFLDRQARPRILRGVAVYSGAVKLAEMAALIGFETVWIEMEHGPAEFTQVEHLCMATEAAGGIPTVRVPDGQRHHVLRALEVGARIVVVPMINTAEQARQIVQYGKFPPLGARGYNVRSRGVEYGLAGSTAGFARANQRTHLFAQIETTEAVDNIDEICSVQGLSGIFIGPGDLSVSFGCTGELSGPKLIDTVCGVIRRARGCGLHAGILVPPGAMLAAATEAGCDLMFYGGDVADLAAVWPKLLASVDPQAKVVRR